MNVSIDEQINEWMNEWMDKWMNERMNEWKDDQMHERIMWIVKRFRDGPTYYILTDRPTNQQIGKTSYRGA